MIHYQEDSATPEWLMMSAELSKAGHTIEFRGGRVIVNGVVAVDSLENAIKLLTEE